MFNKKVLIMAFLAITIIFTVSGTVSAVDSSPTSDLNVSSESQSVEMAPVNPDYVIYENTLQDGATTEDSNSLGYTPSPLYLYYSEDSNTIFILQSTDTVGLPSSYDLRTIGKVTTVKNQGSCGSCWAFATYGSLESYLLTGESCDFSENNLKNLVTSSYADGFDLTMNDGGNQYMAMAYLARWTGPVNESSDPYNASSNVSPTGINPVKHVQGAILIPDRTGSSDNDKIKQAIMTYGAVYTSMYMNESSNYNPSTYSYYYQGTHSSNHAVCIVGWDDSYDKNNFSTPAPGNGAFIVKNSWGTDWGDDGYFYVSYYDSRIGKGNAVFNNAESTTNYNKIYQYDPLGWVSSCGYSSTTAWFSNVFTSTGYDRLAAASFYVASPNSTYQLYAYLNPTDGNPTSGTLIASKTGTISSAGYTTIVLDTPVSLQSGVKFSVVVKITTPGYNYPIPMEYPYSNYSSKATAHAGESYISSNGTAWSDLTTSFPNTNTCLKAFTISGLEVYPGGSIQAAINAATSGDTITVHGNSGSPYIYTENITIDKKITLKTAGDGVVTITASSTSTPVITINSSGSYSSISGFTITGASTSDGIYLNSATNCLMSGNTVSNNYEGVKLLKSNNNVLSGNTVQNNIWAGICLDQSTSNTINNYNQINNNQEGIFLANNSNQNTIVGNYIHHNTGNGISILNSSNGNSLNANTISYNSVMGVFIQNSSNTIVTGNNIQTNTWAGVVLDQATGTTINGANYITGNQEGIFMANNSTGNTITGNNIQNNTGSGISILNSSNNNIYSNTNLSNNGSMGIFIQNSSNEIVTGNNIQSNGWAGICLDQATGNTINNNNNITNNQEGVFMANSSSSNIIQGNIINNNSFTGVSVLNSASNQITGNSQINRNGVMGVFIQNSASTMVYNNTIENNSWGGVILDTTTNSTVYNNNLTDNPEQALAVKGSGNTFYQDTSGNYWSDWTTNDPRPIDGDEGLYDQYPSTTKF